jgi:hypothetical protein
MFACNIYPRQTWFPLAFGTLVEPLGITLLAVAMNWDNVPIICGMLGLTGVGTGIRFMPGILAFRIIAIYQPVLIINLK